MRDSRPRRSTALEYSRGVRVFLTFEENVMFKRNVLGVFVACVGFAAGGAGIYASGGHERTLVVTMTNGPNANELRVYDAQSHVLLQTLSTHGKGGVGGNARGIKQNDGRLVAVVNNGSNSVALFRRDGDVLTRRTSVGRFGRRCSCRFRTRRDSRVQRTTSGRDRCSSGP